MPPELEDVVTRLNVLLAAGAAQSGIARAFDAFEAAGPADRTSLLAWTLSAVEGQTATFGNAARRAIAARLDAVEEHGEEEAEFLAEIRRLVSVGHQPNPAGRITVLLAANGANSFGVVRDLLVRVGPHGGDIRLTHREDDSPSLYVGFWNGATAALELVVRRLSRSLPSLADRLAYDRSVTGTLQASVSGASGESLGLGTAIGTISALTGLAISDCDAFTGQLGRDGRLGRVESLRDKVLAAADAGYQRVFVPADCEPLTPPTGVQVVRCLSLDEVVHQVFDPTAFTVALDQLSVNIPKSDGARPWNSVPDSRPRLLLTMVGTSDPIGTYKDREGKSLPSSEEGPILAACRELDPKRVIAFFTTASKVDFQRKAGEVKAFIDAQMPGCAATLRPLAPALDDPTDLEGLWQAMAAELRNLNTQEPNLFDHYNAFVNMTSGTGQMQFVWAVLTMNRQLPATLLQVRESRFVKDGESRIRRVVLPSAH